MKPIAPFLLALAGIASSIFVYGQRDERTLLVPFRDKKLWGYSDTLGKIRIKPAYDSAVLFYGEPFGRVYKGKKQSLITKQGKLAGIFADDIYRYGNDHYMAYNNDRVGIMDMQGNLIVPVEYERIDWPSMYDDHYYGNDQVIGLKQSGEYLISLKTGAAKKIRERRGENDYGLMDVSVPQIEEMYPVRDMKIKLDPDSLARSLNADSVVLYRYPDYKYLEKDIYRVYRGGKVGIWSNGFGFTPQYDAVREVWFNGKTASVLVEKDKKLGVVNQDGKPEVPVKYASIRRIRDGLFITELNKKKGATILNTNYPPIANKYESMEYMYSLPVNDSWSFILFRVSKNGKRGFVGENGVEYFKD
ncbi:MAG: Protein of unknown function precursor [Chitinophagaceae bacterium]|jgi:hypothetical protein|nr:Protein of unknown function precursor [Chitinophagaceae bacterium]